MIDMKPGILVLAASFAAIVSCAPSSYTTAVEMRYPSKSGLNLQGKNLAVVYLQGDSEAKNRFAENLADGFAYSLEDDYGTGDLSVGVFKFPKTAGADYATADSLGRLMIDTGSDVVFLLDEPEFGAATYGELKASHIEAADSAFTAVATVPFDIRIYCLDGMDKSETVKNFAGRNSVKAPVYMAENETLAGRYEKTFRSLDNEAWKVGGRVAESFVSVWKNENFTFYFYEKDKWLKGLNYAWSHDYKKSMDIWLELVESGSSAEKGCAAYNLSVCSYMLGDYGLALKWLDFSTKLMDISEAPSFRRRIVARQEMN